MSNYRIKYKKGDFELEIESTEKDYVDSMFKELLESKIEPQPAVKKKTPARKPKPATPKVNGGAESADKVDIPVLIEAINDSDDHDAIDENIISKSAQLPRIIMCLKFAESTLESPYLSTGHIQTITDQLGIRIKSQNAATTIKKNQKYFTADGVRKTGALIKYKLNRKGLAAYGKLLKGEKI